MEIKGRVIMNLGVQSGTSKAGKAWSKAFIVIETEGQYPKKIAMDNLKNAEEFGKLAPGTTGTFYIDVESREFNGRWYTSVNCYKWEVANPYPQQQQQPYGQAQSYPVNPQSATPTLDAMGVQGYQPMQYAQQMQTAQNGDDDDSLPF